MNFEWIWCGFKEAIEWLRFWERYVGFKGWLLSISLFNWVS